MHITSITGIEIERQDATGVNASLNMPTRVTHIDQGGGIFPFSFDPKERA